MEDKDFKNNNVKESIFEFLKGVGASLIFVVITGAIAFVLDLIIANGFQM